MSNIVPDCVAALHCAAALLLVALSGCDATREYDRADARERTPVGSPREKAAPPAKGDKGSGGEAGTVREPVRPAPAESRTPEEAAKRAADPKDPSGALIVEPPQR